MLTAAAAAALSALADRAAAAGFDLCAPFAIGADDAGLPRFGRARALGAVIGNTRALWPRFLAAVAADAALAGDPDPLDRYTERALAAAPDALGLATATFFAHASTAAGYVPIQALAERAGLATRAPSGLCVHPIFGPWIALRAVIALDADPLPPRPRANRPCDCASGCQPICDALDRAVARFEPASPSWRDWARLRAACPLGREHAYSDDQLRYHYTRDLSLLRSRTDR